MNIKQYFNEKGFSLLELIIVVAILAIIAGIGVPKLIASIDNSKKTTDIANAKLIADAAIRIRTENDDYGSYITAAVGLDMNTLSSYPSNTFENKLYLELRNHIPIPKYKGTSLTDDETNFILFMDGLGNIRVYVGNSTGVAATEAVIIYPTQASDYLRK